MTKDEVLKLALEALERSVATCFDRYAHEQVMSRPEHFINQAITAIKEALAQPVQPDTDMAYTIALQRAIEWHCDSKAVPPDVAKVCPYHAEMLNKTLAQQETDWEAVAADQAMTIAMMQLEQEPVAWRTFDGEGGYEYRTYDMNEQYAEDWAKRNPKHKGWVEPLYASPPKRQPLTVGEIYTAYIEAANQTLRPQDERIALAFARAIEAAHGIGDKT